jgi:hypothetical protein
MLPLKRGPLNIPDSIPKETASLHQGLSRIATKFSAKKSPAAPDAADRLICRFIKFSYRIPATSGITLEPIRVCISIFWRVLSTFNANTCSTRFPFKIHKRRRVGSIAGSFTFLF